jgi:hypothetical protein
MPELLYQPESEYEPELEITAQGGYTLLATLTVNSLSEAGKFFAWSFKVTTGSSLAKADENDACFLIGRYFKLRLSTTNKWRCKTPS